MNTNTKSTLERLANLTEKEIGSTEENLKQRVMVPLLELLDHNREDLEFEYRTRSGKGKLDIFIKHVPSDCKVIIDTKNYSTPLDDHIEQIKEYAFEEAALLAIIVNGTEIRIYSPLRGVDFERSLIYSFKRCDWAQESVWNKLVALIHKDSLLNRSVLGEIESREKQIKQALSDEERLKETLEQKLSEIEQEIAAKDEEITNLRLEAENIRSEIDPKIARLWESLNLPASVNKQTVFPDTYSPLSSGQPRIQSKHARFVTLQELEAQNLIHDGQILHFYNTRDFPEERVKVKMSLNKIIYLKDNTPYSTSDLAKRLLVKYGFSHGSHGVRGPIFWKTDDGHFLNELNEQVRIKRGNR